MPIKPNNIIGTAHCLLKDIYIKIKAYQISSGMPYHILNAKLFNYNHCPLWYAIPLPQ